MGIVTTSKGKLYVRHMPGGRIRDGMSAHEVAKFVRHAYARGREDGKPRRGGRPANEERALKALLEDPDLLKHVLDGTPLVPLGSQVIEPHRRDPENPHGYEPITPREAIASLLAYEKDKKATATRAQRSSCLHLQADALGWENWEGWIAHWWDWLYKNYGRETGRSPHISAANKLIRWGKLKAVRRYVPDFKPDVDRPEQSKQDRLAEMLAEEPTEPYKLSEMHAMNNVSYVLYGPDHYAALMEAICGLAGFSPIDARYLLAGNWANEAEGFEWTGPGGLVWYCGWRRKTGERIDVPLAPTLATLLEPLREGERGIRYRGVSGRGTNGSLPTSSFQFSSVHNRIEAKAGVEHIEGQGLRRYRTSFQVILENDLRVPEPIRKRLMGHKLRRKGDAAIKAYGRARRQETVDAILAYDAHWTDGM